VTTCFCSYWRRTNNDEDILFTRSEEEENKGDDIAPIGCLEARKKTKAWLWQVAEKRTQRGKHTTLIEKKRTSRRHAYCMYVL
jgi:hypothetical protein